MRELRIEKPKSPKDIHETSEGMDQNSWLSDPGKFFDPYDPMTQEEWVKADPLITKSISEQAEFEMSRIIWPNPWVVARKVIFFVIVLFLFHFIDILVSRIYTHFGIISTGENMATYAA